MAPCAAAAEPDTAAAYSSSDTSDGEHGAAGRRYIRLPCGCICIGEASVNGSSVRAGDATGRVVWGASEELADWCCRERRPQQLLASFSSAVELGAGCGLVSIALAKLGLHVVSTDGDTCATKLIQRNASRNGVEATRLRALQYAWESETQLEEVLQAVGRGGRCSEVLVASDVIYSSDDTSFAPLEAALRALIGRGGCRLVVMCWRVRNGNEERFLSRLADLGRARIAWRSHGLSCADSVPADGSDDMTAWRKAHAGSWAIGTLEVGSDELGRDADGGVYDGEWKAGDMDGRRTPAGTSTLRAGAAEFVPGSLPEILERAGLPQGAPRSKKERKAAAAAARSVACVAVAAVEAVLTEEECGGVASIGLV